MKKIQRRPFASALLTLVTIAWINDAVGAIWRACSSATTASIMLADDTDDPDDTGGLANEAEEAAGCDGTGADAGAVDKIGRAAGRERGGKAVEISGGGGT